MYEEVYGCLNFMKELRENAERNKNTVTTLTRGLEYGLEALMKKIERQGLLDGVKVLHLEDELEDTLKDRNELISDLIDHFENTKYDVRYPEDNEKWITRLNDYLRG